MSTRRVLIGDSHASGLAAAAARAGRPFAAHASFSGQRTRTIAASGWLAANGSGATEVWIVSSGNDRAADDLGPSVQSLLRQAEGAKRVVWVSPPHALLPALDEQHTLTTTRIGGLLPRRGVSFIDSRPLTQTGHASDGVHFTAAGYDRWYAGIEEQLEGGVNVVKVLGASAIAVGVLAAGFAIISAAR